MINLMVDELTYMNYAYNRRRTPGIAPERWKLVYGERVDGMEQRFLAESTLNLKPLAPATYCGVMTHGDLTVELWDLTEDIPGHPKGSTISESTLRDAGYSIPNRRLDTAPASE